MAQRPVVAAGRVGEAAADGDANPRPAVFRVPQQRFGRGLPDAVRRVVQKLGQALDNFAVVAVGQSVDGGGADLRFQGAAGGVQDHLGLSDLPVLAKFQGREGGDADLRPGVAQQFQGRGGVHVQRLAQRLDFRQQAAGVETGRPVRPPGQLAGQ